VTDHPWTFTGWTAVILVTSGGIQLRRRPDRRGTIRSCERRLTVVAHINDHYLQSLTGRREVVLNEARVPENVAVNGPVLWDAHDGLRRPSGRNLLLRL